MANHVVFGVPADMAKNIPAMSSAARIARTSSSPTPHANARGERPTLPRAQRASVGDEYDRRMRVVCLSSFDESQRDDRTAIEKVKQWIDRLVKPSEGQFTPIKNKEALLEHLKTLTGVDLLILAAHGYADGDLRMRDGAKAAASDVVAALKVGALAEKAILFVFACNGILSPAFPSLFPAEGRGQRMVFGAKRLALSNPMTSAFKRIAGVLDRRELAVSCAKSIVDDELACQVDPATHEVTEPKTSFLRVIWGQGPSERYPD